MSNIGETLEVDRVNRAENVGLSKVVIGLGSLIGAIRVFIDMPEFSVRGAAMMAAGLSAAVIEQGRREYVEVLDYSAPKTAEATTITQSSAI